MATTHYNSTTGEYETSGQGVFVSGKTVGESVEKFIKRLRPKDIKISKSNTPKVGGRVKSK